MKASSAAVMFVSLMMSTIIVASFFIWWTDPLRETIPLTSTLVFLWSLTVGTVLSLLLRAVREWQGRCQ